MPYILWQNFRQVDSPYPFFSSQYLLKTDDESAGNKFLRSLLANQNGPEFTLRIVTFPHP